MRKILLPLFTLMVPMCSWSGEAPEESYIADKQGCHLEQIPEVGPARTLRWKGRCKSGYPDGAGTLTTYIDGKLDETENVTFRNKLREGTSRTAYTDSSLVLRAESEYNHGKLNGKQVEYLANGDVLQLHYVDGNDTHHVILASKNGDKFEGEILDGGLAKGKWDYADGSHYEGAKLRGAMNGEGVFTRKDGSIQRGEFILDEFVDIKDETAARLMPSWFGLKLGMTRKQVEALVGKMEESPNSIYRNAFDVEKFPNEKFAAPNLRVGLRTVYFDDDGKLWRVWAQIHLDKDTLFGGAEVMQAYGSVRRYLSLNNDIAKSGETFPNYGAGIESCRNVEEWEKDNPKSYEMALATAPRMAPSQRVIFDIGCGAIPFWGRAYTSRDGKERYFVAIRYGNLYATPVIYSASVADEEGIGKKMRKTPPAQAPAASSVSGVTGMEGGKKPR